MRGAADRDGDGRRAAVRRPARAQPAAGGDLFNAARRCCCRPRPTGPNRRGARRRRRSHGTRIYDAVDGLRCSAPREALGLPIVLSDGADTGSAGRWRRARTARGERARSSPSGCAPRLRSAAAAALATRPAAPTPRRASPTTRRIYDALGRSARERVPGHYRSLRRGRASTCRSRSPASPVSPGGLPAPTLPAPGGQPARRPLGSRPHRCWIGLLVVLRWALLVAFVVLSLVAAPQRALRPRSALRRPRLTRSSAEDRADRGSRAAPSGRWRPRWWAAFSEDARDRAGFRSRRPGIVLGSPSACSSVAAGARLRSPARRSCSPRCRRSRLACWCVRARDERGARSPTSCRTTCRSSRRRCGPGHSLVGALSVVVDDAAEPSRSEFRRVLADEQLGIPLETAMADVARRMHSRDLDAGRARRHAPAPRRAATPPRSSTASPRRSASASSCGGSSGRSPHRDGCRAGSSRSSRSGCSCSSLLINPATSIRCLSAPRTAAARRRGSVIVTGRSSSANRRHQGLRETSMLHPDRSCSSLVRGRTLLRAGARHRRDADLERWARSAPTATRCRAAAAGAGRGGG